MDTIKNYLEMMFANLPDTAEVRKAKDQLWQMMEDKYDEMINEGKPENEAVAKVISEFGNLEELAESLGIKGVVQKNAPENRRKVSQEEIESYVHDKKLSSFFTGLSVFLYICCVCPVILKSADTMNESDLMYDWAVGAMFLIIALATGIIIFASTLMGKWKFLNHQACTIDYATVNYVNGLKEAFRRPSAILYAVGVILCVMCVVPVIICGNMVYEMGQVDASIIGVVLMFVMVGAGVFLLIYASSMEKAYKRLMRLNDAATVSGNFIPEQNEGPHYSSKRMEAIMSVYWEVITCIYLIISFLTMKWNITWIIWPIAAVAKKLILAFCGIKEEDDE